MLSSMLHSIGVGNMLPSWVKVVCVDINPAVVTKLSDRGSTQTIGVVTDVGLFLHQLAEHVARTDHAQDPDRSVDARRAPRRSDLGRHRLPLRSRPTPRRAKSSIARRHIPGARYAHLDRDLSGTKTGKNGRHPLPTPT